MLRKKTSLWRGPGRPLGALIPTMELPRSDLQHHPNKQPGWAPPYRHIPLARPVRGVRAHAEPPADVVNRPARNYVKEPRHSHILSKWPTLTPLGRSGSKNCLMGNKGDLGEWQNEA